VVKKVGRKICNFKLKEIEEDVDGAAQEVNGKLSSKWDMTWHDLGISADFLTKM